MPPLIASSLLLNLPSTPSSDSQSFPLCLPSAPGLCEYGAYSESETYSYDDAVDLLNYALLRGVMVVPEIDAPMHAANGWQFGSQVQKAERKGGEREGGGVLHCSGAIWFFLFHL